MSLPDFRSHFPHIRHVAYLDHASVAPLNTPVLEAVSTYLEQRHATRPNNYRDVLPVIERARGRLAALIGAHVSRVDFAPNTSYAINILAQGLDWRPGDRVAVPDCEFPANVYPWLGLANRGVEVDFIPAPDGTFSPDDVARALTPRTRVLAVSWVQFLSGFRCDLAALSALCRDRGVILSLDAIQGLGALRLDVAETPVDFLACGGQKWIMGMVGTGFFYVSEALQERLTPLRGWFNGPLHWDELLAYSMELHDDARRFRVGTLNNAGIVALDAALGLYFDAGPEAVQERVMTLAQYASHGLDALGLTRQGAADPAAASGIVAVIHPDPDAALAALESAGVQAAVRERRLRLSPTWYNTEEEIDLALDVLARLEPR
jgi:selenocysteine lyase/cysteine desulfurase